MSIAVVVVCFFFGDIGKGKGALLICGVELVVVSIVGILISSSCL